MNRIVFLKFNKNIVERNVFFKNQLRLLSNKKNDSNDNSNVPSSAATADSDKKSLKKSSSSDASPSSVVGDTKDEKFKKLLKKSESIKSIGPNDSKTINKIISKPRLHIRQSARPKEDLKNQKHYVDDEPIETISKGLDKRLVEAARRVADRMPKHLAKKTEQELLQSIQKHQQPIQQQQQQGQGKKSKSSTPISTSKEDFTQSISYKLLKKSSPPSKEKISFDDKYLGSTTVKVKITSPTSAGTTTTTGSSEFNNKFRKRTNLFSEECLGIFNPKSIYKIDLLQQNSYWNFLQKKQLELLTKNCSTENYFDEMIQLTQKGILWKFPIDNEQDLQEEQLVPFYDHVLSLDKYLNDFPEEGPVRQFIELVIMGLSQNPYISVQRKIETILFYKKFFEERNLLTPSTSTTTEDHQEEQQPSIQPN